jgi:alanyl-tRNA synthetase
VLGDHVQQKGSLVDHEKTRFDFSHPKPLTPEEIERVERLVNEKIRQNVGVHWQEVPQEQALRINGLRAVFGERYPDVVRVLSVGVPVDELVQQPDNPGWREVSVEFCGGTHVKSTGQIESFAIAAEEAVAKGVRRIIGLTGETAERVKSAGEARARRAEQLLEATPAEAHTGLAELQSELAARTIPMAQRATLRRLLEELQKRAKQEQKASAADAASVVLARVIELLENARKVGATTIVVSEMPNVPLDALKTGADAVKQKAGSAAVLFGSAADGKVTLLAAMSNDLVQRGVKAGDLVKAVAPIVGGGGGGPPTMAQAGGKLPEKLGEALEAGRKWIADRLA